MSGRIREAWAVAGLAVAVALAQSASANRPEDRPRSDQRTSSVHGLELGRGVNIIGYDPIWRSFERGRFKARHFQLIKAGGFDTVRINLHAFRHMEPTGDHTLKPTWLKTLDWAVENALKNDLNVILDLHEFNTMGKDPEGNKSKFLAFWKQIAPRFRDAPKNVVFELLNEPSRKLTPELWRVYYREALGIVRKTNPTRAVIIGPPSWNSVKHLDGLKLPEDDRNLIVTVHYYSPFPFTHQGARWTNQRDKSGIEWRGTQEEIAAIEADFRAADEWSKKNRRPIFLGEFGAYDRAPMDSRVRYTATVARTAEKLGWSWAYWQFDSDFIAYDIKSDRWVEPIHRALIPKESSPPQ